MARAEVINFSPHTFLIHAGRCEPVPIKPAREGLRIPQLFWGDGTPWSEANVWLMTALRSKDVAAKTVDARAADVKCYMDFLEAERIPWHHFPVGRADRCLVRYRGFLIDRREKGQLAPSTATRRMRTVLRLYRWLREAHVLAPDWPMWVDRQYQVRWEDRQGFQRTLQVTSTDLAIRNRRAPGERLEDGLWPVSPEVRDAILKFANAHAPVEFFLMLCAGFFTGMRLQSIADLRLENLRRASPYPGCPDLLLLHIGPAARPPVATKGSVSGHVLIPRHQAEALLEYGASARRLIRSARADASLRDHVFLTISGKPYAQRGLDRSVAVNVAMHAIRAKAKREGFRELACFKFHQTRCTFATEVAKIALDTIGPKEAVGLVQQLLLHKEPETTLRYLRFVERNPVRIDLANSFTRAFMASRREA